MKILILSPGKRKYELTFSKKTFGFYRSTLPLLASLIPNNHFIDIHDESIDGLINPQKKSYDLILLSPMTAFAPRAYELSKQYKKSGATIIMGGSHVSSLPHEALKYCDAVCIGEGETILPQIINEAESGNLTKQIYRGEYPDIQNNYPKLKWDLANKSLINIIRTIDISRGCPYKCEFCSVSEYQGSKYRFRSVESIVNEIECSNSKYIYLNSDNIVGNHNYAKKLFKALGNLNIKWVSQASITMASDEDLLDLIYKSGCFGVCIGFESISQDSLSSTKKTTNKVKQYIEAVKRIHTHGITIQGSFIVGFDTDTIGVADRTLEFILDAKLDLAFPHILTPYPSTETYNKLALEDRIIRNNYPNDWQYYDTSHVVFEPKNISEDELQSEYNQFLKEVLSLQSIHKRARYSERALQNLSIYLLVNSFHKYKNQKILRKL